VYSDDDKSNHAFLIRHVLLKRGILLNKSEAFVRQNSSNLALKDMSELVNSLCYHNRAQDVLVSIAEQQIKEVNRLSGI